MLYALLLFRLLAPGRKRLDVSRKKFAVLKRKLETEFNALDTMEAKVDELDKMRKAEEVRRGGGGQNKRSVCACVWCVCVGGVSGRQGGGGAEADWVEASIVFKHSVGEIFHPPCLWSI